MGVVKKTITGSRFLEKVKTGADIGTVSTTTLFEKFTGNDVVVKVLTLTGSYFVGSNTLHVFMNGQRLENIATPILVNQYKELNSNQIEFGVQPLASDVITAIVH